MLAQATEVQKPAFSRPKQNYNTYLIEDELYVGVSAILNTEAVGDFLTHWILKTFGNEPDPIAAHKNYMENVSGIGTAIHKYIEHDLAGEESLAQTFARPDTIDAIESYHAWKSEHKVEVLASELTVHSPAWKCAGTLDAVLKIDGKVYVVDFKTGKFKPRYFTQLAAYKGMLMHMPKKKQVAGIKNAELAVLEILRDGSPVKLITLEDKYGGMLTEQDELNVFHNLRNVWYLRNLRTKQFQPIVKNMETLLDPMDKGFQKQFKLLEGEK